MIKVLLPFNFPLRSRSYKNLERKRRKWKAVFFLLLRTILVRSALYKAGKSYINIFLPLGAMSVKTSRYSTSGRVLSFFTWHCSHWNWTVQCCSCFLWNPRVHSLLMLLTGTAGADEGIYLQERAASFLVRLLTEGIDFIIRAKWHLPGNRHVESYLLCMYL